MNETVEREINPAPRLLMGPGPINADPRVLRAMSAQLLGQFDPQFRDYMKEVSELYRGVFQTDEPLDAARRRHRARGDRSGARIAHRARRPGAGAGVRPLRPPQGRDRQALRRRSDAVEIGMGDGFRRRNSSRRRSKQFKPKIVAVSHGDTSTTMAQPLAELGKLCRAHDALLYVDATATLGGMDLPTDAWQLDVVSAGLQKCLGGPSGSAPLTLNERAEKGHRSEGGTWKQGCRRTTTKDGRRPGHPLELLRPRDDHGLLVGQGAEPSHRGDHDALRGARVRPHPAAGRAADRPSPATPRLEGPDRRPAGDGARSSSATSATRWPT